jgi:hypothetical protein
MCELFIEIQFLEFFEHDVLMTRISSMNILSYQSFLPLQILLNRYQKAVLRLFQFSIIFFERIKDTFSKVQHQIILIHLIMQQDEFLGKYLYHRLDLLVGER